MLLLGKTQKKHLGGGLPPMVPDLPLNHRALSDDLN